MTMARPPFLPAALRAAVAADYVARRDELAEIFADFYGVATLDDRLGEITAPTLVMWGEEDRLVHPSTARAWAEGIAGARTVALPRHRPHADAGGAGAQRGRLPRLPRPRRRGGPTTGRSALSGSGRPAVDWVAMSWSVSLRPPERRALRGDVVAGITVAAYLVPQVLAYSGLARVPPAAGLWAAFVALAVYFLLGSSPQLSVGPESTTALMTGAALATLTVPGESAQDTAAVLALAVGAVCLIAWAGGLAFLADLLSKPVLVGYMAGIAGLMVLSQTGARERRRRPRRRPCWPRRGGWLQHPSAVHVPTLAVCLGTLAAAARRRPAVAHRSGAAGRHAGGDPRAWPLAGLSDDGVAVVGALPFALPSRRPAGGRHRWGRGRC